MKIYKKKELNEYGYSTDYIYFKDCQDCLKWRNFAGVAKAYNEAGKRNFSVQVSPEMAEFFRNEGINVHSYTPKASDWDENPEEQLTVSVKVVFGSQKFPIDISVGNDETKTKVSIDGDTAYELDTMSFKKASFKARKYMYDSIGGKCTLYLVKAFFVKNTDDLDDEFSDFFGGDGYDTVTTNEGAEEAVPFN